MPPQPRTEPRAEIRALCVVCGQEAPRLALVDTYGISPAWLLPSVLLTGSVPLVVARVRARRAQRLASPSEPLWGLSKEEA